MSAYYNENDPKAAAWLRELIKAGLIAPGYVDERSITDVTASDLRGFTQCHFFAGIGGWSYALRLAGWPDSRPVWTGSCPCQPFSAAGEQKGEKDERHLWPVLSNLIESGQPPVCFGEQVASALGRQWLAGVFADLERMGYRRAAADLCAAGVGAPHIRQRLFWMAYAAGARSFPGTYPRIHSGEESGGARNGQPERCGAIGRVAYADEQHGDGARSSSGNDSGEQQGTLSLRRFWNNFDILPCLDGKARRIESGTFPLAHGVSGRVGLLRGYGNAIVPEKAAEFIQAAEEAIAEIGG